METPVLKLEHADARGEIYSISLPGDKELMLLYSKKGSLRGGHAHAVNEIVLLLTGKIKYHIKKDRESQEYTSDMDADKATHHFQAGNILHGLAFHPKGEYHMGEFLEDSWLIEFKLNAGKEEWKNDVDYAPWRERVKANASSPESTVR